MKVLFTGLGSVGRQHLKSLRRVCDEAPEVIAYRSNKGTGPSGDDPPSVVEDVREYYSLEEALDRAPDVGFVTNPTHCHRETALRLARAGVPFLVEKPLSDSLQGLGELVETIQERNLTTLMGCQLRFHPVLERTRSILRDEEVTQRLHNFRVTCGSYLPDWRPGRDYRETYSAKAEEGGGVVLDLIHEFDYLHWWFGQPSDVRSYTGRVSHLELDSEDLAEAILRYDESFVGTVHLDYFRPEPTREFELVGEEFLLKGDLISDRLVVTRDGETRSEEFTVDEGELYDRQLSYFLTRLDRDEPCENDVSSGREVLETALRVKEEGF